MITTNTTELKTALQSITSIVDSRTVIPILGHVLIESKGGAAVLTCSNSDIEAKTTIGADGDLDITLPAKKLHGIVSALPDNSQIRIKPDGTVLCNRSKYKLTSLPVSEFPRVNPSSFVDSIDINGELLKSTIAKTSISMADQDVRYYLNGMLFDLRGGSMVMVSTDGHRMTCSSIDGGFHHEGQYIIPKKTILFLQKLKYKTDVSIEFSANHISFDTGEIKAISKLIDGRYPDYLRVMPSASNGFVASAKKDDITASLVRSSILSNEKYNGARITFGKDSIQIESNNPDQESSVEMIDAESNAEGVEIGVNIKYVMQAISQVDADSVRISHISENEKFLIEDGGTSFVIMPMRL